MKLYGTLSIPEIRGPEPLATLDVISDTARQHDPMYFRRDVIGTIRKRGSIWHDYITTFLGIAMDSTVQQMLPPFKRPFRESEREFIPVNGLQVNHDLYALGSWLNVEGDTLRIILMESHFGTVEEYEEKLRERNARAESLIEHALSGRFTLNDYREYVMGYPRDPQFEKPYPAKNLQEMFADRRWLDATRNIV